MGGGVSPGSYVLVYGFKWTTKCSYLTYGRIKGKKISFCGRPIIKHKASKTQVSNLTR